MSTESLSERERTIVLLGLGAISLLAWAYMFHLARGMGEMHMHMEMGMAMAVPQMQSWGLADLTFLFGMWAVMMVAMMLPSASPMILLFAALNRRKQEQNSPFVPSGVFLLGYLAAWAAFSLLATLAQWGLHTAGLLSPMMESTSPLLGGLLLAAAGVYQWTPLKQACLRHCRSPLDFLASHWKEGHSGAFAMGIEHGAFCLGCCWVLMSLLFVAGVMNLFWVAALAIFVLLEKVVPGGVVLGRLTGALLLLAGLSLATHPYWT